MRRDPEARWALFRPLDVLVALALLAGAGACIPYLFAPFGGRAEVTVEGRKTARLDLHGPPRELTVATALGPLRLGYGNGSVRVTQAPCPNRLCMRTGPVSRAGASLLCVPAKVRVTLSGGGKGPDAVTF